MEKFKLFSDLLAAAANIFTVLASGLAIYVFLLNRKKLAAALDLLLSYSFQTTLGELKEKVERLNEYNANEPDDVPEIRNILHEISGQIRGNGRLTAKIPRLAEKIDKLANAKRIAETSKRSIVSETREQLKNIQITNIETIAGIDNE
ncbi:hypothetical protein [Paraburkholderia graminis]|uniref:hypothetical protein n=1 Tax=Paraburkholderia graminis TaxID=60548 RepID=UPI0038BD7D67